MDAAGARLRLEGRAARHGRGRLPEAPAALLLSRTAAERSRLGKTKQVDQAQAARAAFYFPNGVAVAKDGRVFVADGDNRRIQVFDDKGEFKQFIDTSGVPRGLAIDAKHRLYVVDALAHTVDLYSLDGEQLVQFRHERASARASSTSRTTSRSERRANLHH